MRRAVIATAAVALLAACSNSSSTGASTTAATTTSTVAESTTAESTTTTTPAPKYAATIDELRRNVERAAAAPFAVLIDGESVKVIDFDDCGFSWYMYDAATPVSFYEHEPHVPELLEHWKAGYRKVLPLSAEDEAEIPTFVMLRHILLVAWISSHIEAEFPRSLGAGYTEGSLPLCEDYLRRFSSAAA